MSHSIPHLTKKERQALELAIHGVPIDRMAVQLNQSAKVVERYIHRGLHKLEAWSREVAPGPSYHSPYEGDLGFLRPREAEREITRLIKGLGNEWGCIVVLAIPNGPKSPDIEATIDYLSKHIRKSLRSTDIVTKWSMTEWIIFLPRITSDGIETVARRLPHSDIAPWPVFVSAQKASGDDGFTELAMQCHRQLISQYVSHDLALYVLPLAGIP